jgi:hypothetical protein
MDTTPHPNFKERFAHIVVWVILAVACLVILRLVTWGTAPTDVIEVKNAPVPVRTIRPVAQADGVVFLDVDFCKKTDAVGRLRMSFVNERRSREVFTPVAEERQKAACERRELAIAIPHDISTDTYHVHFRIEYQLNPLKRVVEEFDSKDFKVIGNEE